MKRTILIVSLTFVVTLTLIFGIRASADAVAVVLGVILGVVASVPTTVLVTYILTRPRPGYGSSQSGPMPYQPPVVVINAADRAGIAPSVALPALNAPSPERKWTVIGDLETNAYEDIELG